MGAIRASAFKRDMYINSAKELAEFYNTHGVLPSEQTEPKLSRWRFGQTKEYNKRTITDEKMQILMEICPFIFEGIIVHSSWDDRYDRLDAFMRTNLRQPLCNKDDSEERSLYSYIRHSVKMYKNGKLSEESVDKMRALLPEKFGGDPSNSMIRNKLKECDLPKEIDISEKQMISLVLLGVATTAQLIIEVKGILNHQDQLSTKELEIMRILELKVCRAESSLVQCNKSIKLANKLNELVYNIPVEKIRLLSAIRKGVKLGDAIVYEFGAKYLDTMLNQISGRYKEVLVSSICNGKTLQSIGEELEITGGRVGQIQYVGLRKLRHCRMNSILHGKNLNLLIPMIIPKKSMLSIRELDLSKEKLELLEQVAIDIKKAHNTECNLNFMLGLEYLGMFQYGEACGLDKLNSGLIEIAAKSAAGKMVYATVFQQGELLSKKELVEAVRKLKADIIGIKEGIGEIKTAQHIGIKELDLSNISYNIMMRYGYDTLHLLTLGMASGTIKGLRGVGSTIYIELQEKLEAFTSRCKESKIGHDTGIAELGLHRKTYCTLIRRGYGTVGELISCMLKGELLNINGIAEKTAKEVQEKVEEFMNKEVIAQK